MATVTTEEKNRSLDSFFPSLSLSFSSPSQNKSHGTPHVPLHAPDPGPDQWPARPRRRRLHVRGQWRMIPLNLLRVCVPVSFLFFFAY